MKVVLTELALADLRDISQWIGLDSVVAAKRFLNELRRCCFELGDRSTLYPLATGLEHARVRRRLHRGYLIFYRVEGASIQVLGVMHGSRDWPDLISERT